MGVLDRISNLAGNVAKAKLSFPKIGATQTQKEAGAHAAVKDGLKAIADTAASVDPTGTVAGVKNSIENLIGEKKTLTVQFNPASLNIEAYGGGRFPISNYSGDKGKTAGTIDYGPLAVYITVSYTLIFDSVDIGDAFAADKFNLSVSSLAKNITSAVSTGITGREYTVRPFVEGFLAAVRDPDHRTVIFEWGKLRYVGVMNRVSCKYTMFNPNGEPIRAEVQVSMLSESNPQADYRSERDEEGKVRKPGALTNRADDYLGYWTNRYTEIVGSHDALKGSTLKNIGTSLINL